MLDKLRSIMCLEKLIFLPHICRAKLIIQIVSIAVTKNQSVIFQFVKSILVGEPIKELKTDKYMQWYTDEVSYQVFMIENGSF